MSRDLVPVTASLHPLRTEFHSLAVPYGTTISEILRQSGVSEPLARFVTVQVGGFPVEPRWWDHVYPRTDVVIKVVPRDSGDGEKNMTRTVMLIGVTMLGGAVASGYFAAGGQTFLTTVAGAAVTLAGRHLVNQIAPPPTPDEPGDGPTISQQSGLEGARNRIRRWGVIPRVFGKHRMTPPMAARPFTEVEGNDHYLNIMVCWGYGPLDITDLRIGATPITGEDDSSFHGVTNLETVSDTSVEGFPSTFKNTVVEDNLSVALTSGNWEQRTTSTEADEISVDIVFPQGVFELEDDGDRRNLSVLIDIEYAEAGTGDWRGQGVTTSSTEVHIPAPVTRYTTRTTGNVDYHRMDRIMVDKMDGTIRRIEGPPSETDAPVTVPPNPDHSHTIALVTTVSGGVLDGVSTITGQSNDNLTGFSVSRVDAFTVDVSPGSVGGETILVDSKKSGTIRKSVNIKTPDGTKQYDVRLRRITEDHDNDDERYSSSVWSSLRSIQYSQPVSMEGVALTAIRIRATDQLNGVIDELNGIVQAIMPEWDPDNQEWVEDAAASSPAAAFRHVLEGRATERNVDSSRIDLESLAEWAEFTQQAGLEYNAVIERETSVPELLSEIASQGRAAHSMADGKWSVVIDKRRDHVVQHFTPRNARGFSSEKTFHEKTHAIRGQFNNAAQDWQQDEVIVYNDDFDEDSATRFETIEFRGATSEHEVYRSARYHLAVDELRPETYSFTTGIDHLVATRGDLIRMAYDLPQWGSGYGRVKSLSNNQDGAVEEVTLDSEIDLEAGNDYVVRFRLFDGTSQLVNVRNPTDITRTATFELAPPVAHLQPQVGDMAMVGISEQESVELIIKSIRPNEDFEAEITAVDYSPAIFDAHEEAIPDFDPRITDDFQYVRDIPPEPVVEEVVSGGASLKIEPDGTLTPRIIVSITIPSNAQVPDSRVFQLRYRIAGSEDEWTISRSESDEKRVIAADVDEGDSYELEVRTISTAGTVSEWVTASSNHQVIGKTAPPRTVSSFSAHAARDRIELTWQENPAKDVREYEIREGNTWDSATFVATVSGTSYQTGSPSNGPWLIKARDTSDNESEEIAEATITPTMPESQNVTVQVIDNSALVRWDTGLGTFILDTHEIRRGPELITAEVVGNSDNTFDIIQETVGGTYTYWILPVDAAGNEGTPASITTSIDDPPDFVLSANFRSDWQSDSVSNIVPQLSSPSPARRTTRDYPALQFDGVDDFLDVSDEAWSSTAFTLESLIYKADFDSKDAVVLGKQKNGILWVDHDGRLRFEFRNDADNAWRGIIRDGGTEYDMRAHNGTWVHVAATFGGSGSTAKAYVNSVLVSESNTIGEDPRTDSGRLEIGRWAGAGTRYFDGRITETRVWNDVRTQSEIETYMERTLNGSESGLLGYWRIQRGRGGETVTDKSGNGHDAGINGTNWHLPSVTALLPVSNLSRDDLHAMGYTTRDQMIAAGYNYRCQPTPSTASIVEVYDAGVAIASTRIQVTLGSSTVVGSELDTTVTISTKQNLSDDWNDFPTGTNPVFATQFRYVKVSIDFSKPSAGDDTWFSQIREFETVLATKLIDDSGVAQVDSNPTTVTFNNDFIDVEGVTATPQGTTSRHAVIDFSDVPNPTSFDIYLFDQDGNAITGQVRWQARGY